MKPLFAKLLFGFVFACSQAHAWCDSHPGVAQEFKENRYVFVGKVESAKDLLNAHSMVEGTYYTLLVTENLKGHPELRIIVFSENTSARFPMDAGSSYLVFVDRERSEVTKTLEYVISNCGNSGPKQKSGKMLAKVRKLADPDERYLRFPPRLSEKQAIALVERAAKSKGRNLAEYEPGPGGVRYDDRERHWIVLYTGLNGVIGNHFMVTVSDVTGMARYIPGL